MEVRPFICFSLFFIFLAVFGYPAFLRFNSRGILVESHEENVDIMTPPTITVCPRNPDSQSKSGWKANLTKLPTDFSVIENSPCQNSESIERLEECIESHVYRKEEIFENLNFNAVNLTSWEDYYSFVLLGKCFVLKPGAGTIGFSQPTALSIALNNSLEYMILMHDPGFLVVTSNPTVVPRLVFSIDENYGEKTVYMEATKHVKMNRDDNPCEEEAGYSFHDCFRQYIADKVGCNSLWGSFPWLQKCSSVEKVKEYERINNEIVLMDRRNLTNHTGCLLPCSFTVYSLAEEPFNSVGFEPKVGLDVMFGQRSITVDKEGLIYPFDSFIAEIGGSLGLFLGFSFLMGLDIIHEACIKMQKYFK